MTEKDCGLLLPFLGIVFSVWRWIGPHTPKLMIKSSARYFAETVALWRAPNATTFGNTLTIAGEFKPFRTSTFTRKWPLHQVIHVDVGDHVKAVRRSRPEIPSRPRTRRRDAGVAALKEEFGGRKETSARPQRRTRQPLRLCPV